MTRLRSTSAGLGCRWQGRNGAPATATTGSTTAWCRTASSTAVSALDGGFPASHDRTQPDEAHFDGRLEPITRSLPGAAGSESKRLGCSRVSKSCSLISALAVRQRATTVLGPPRGVMALGAVSIGPRPRLLLICPRSKTWCPTLRAPAATQTRGRCAAESPAGSSFPASPARGALPRRAQRASRSNSQNLMSERTSAQ